jgi:large subunit ribosomal protein L13
LSAPAPNRYPGSFDRVPPRLAAERPEPRSECREHERGEREAAFDVSTFTPKPSDITRQWHVIDAENAVLGRLATEVATLLRGKHKPIYAPHVDTGDHVIVVNAAKLAVSPKKAKDKLYHRHTGYPGGVRTRSLGDQLARDPEKVVRLAVRRMLPKGPLGRQMLRKLRVHAGPTHPHQAQQPVVRRLPDRAYARTTA